ncbi:MAG: PAS domain S-box protein [Anaerolineales bacterium]|nr:PAS domain S-box protein [Anaerolineales bacterium]
MLTQEQLNLIRQCSRDEDAYQQILAILETQLTSPSNPAPEEQEQIYETAFDIVPVGITVHALDGTLIAYNQRACEILHIPPDRLEELDPRLSTWQTVHPDGSPVNPFDLPGGRALRSGKPEGGELYGAHLIDGAFIWVEAYAAPLFREGAEQPYAVVASLVDVTRWREAEAAVREQEALLLQLAEHIQEVFYVRDMATQKMIYVSPAYETIWGRSPAEVLEESNSFRRYIHPDDLEEYHRLRQFYRDKDMPSEISYRIIRDDGQVRWIHTRDFPIRDEQGQTYRIAGIAEDVTTQVEYRQLLESMNEQLETRVAERTDALERANERLQELSRAKNQFIGNISHELKTPLTSVKLYLHLLEARPEKAPYYREALNRETDRLTNLVDNLLSISRLDRQTQEVDLQPLILDQLVQQFVADREQTVQEKQLKIDFYTKTKNPAVVEADERLLIQALGFVFTNALNYTSAQGHITVVVQPRLREDKAGFSIHVVDNGYGFTAEEAERLFERFYRGSAARQMKIPGTGLGLAIAAEIIDRHHGRIMARSDGLNQGAEFEIWLPQWSD